MTSLYPLLLQPEFHQRVWGARDLSPLYPNELTSQGPIGEAWFSADSCEIANGPLAGQTLGALCQQHREALVGGGQQFPERYPLLVKFLFPTEKLSVQVHPDDAQAAKVGEPCGKTECWYVASAEADGSVGLGLKPGVTREQFGQAILGDGAEQLLNWLPCSVGDMFYVGAGAAHAVGPGAVLIETQQNSDTTYRLYDYNRGRELHVEKGLAALKEAPIAGRVAPEAIAGMGEGLHQTLIAAPYFAVERHGASSQGVRELRFAAIAGAQLITVARGAVRVDCGAAVVAEAKAGEAVALPANVDVVITGVGDFEFLRMTTPTAAVAEPTAKL